MKLSGEMINSFLLKVSGFTSALAEPDQTFKGGRSVSGIVDHLKLQENLSCKKCDGGSFFHTSYGVAQIQIKRATVKVRQGKIYVGKLPTEVSKSKQIDKHVTFDAKKTIFPPGLYS